MSGPSREPLGYVGLRPIRGFIAFYGYAPALEALKECVDPPSSLERLVEDSRLVLVSSSLRGALRIGDVVELAGERLRVADFFDPKALAYLKDVGATTSYPRSLSPTALWARRTRMR